MARQFSLRDLELLDYVDPTIVADTPGWTRVSGYPEPRLFFSKDSFGDLQRFMDNRQLTGRIADAYKATKV